MAQNSQGGLNPVAIGIAGLVGIALLVLAAPLLILGRLLLGCR
jgi:hypothetical protein